MTEHDSTALASGTAQRRALAAMTLAIVLWTTNVYFVRKADDILLFTTWRMVLAIPVLAATAAVLRVQPARPSRVERNKLGHGVWLGLIAIGVLFAVSALVNFTALNETTLVNVGVIHALQPAVVALLAGRFLDEAVDWGLAARVGLAIAGACLVAAASAGAGTWSLHGDLLAVFGLGLNSLWFLAGRWVRTRTHLDATTYMSVVFATASVTLVAAASIAGRSLAVDRTTIVLAGLTAVCGTIGHTLVAWSHRFLPAAMSSLFLLSQPVLIAVLAWLAFEERLHPLDVVGGAIVLASLTGIVRRRGAAPAAATTPDGMPDLIDDASAGSSQTSSSRSTGQKPHSRPTGTPPRRGQLRSVQSAAVAGTREAQNIDLRMRGGHEHASYEQLFELSAMPTLIIDHHARRIVRANRAATAFLGLEAHEVVGMPGPDLLLQPSPDHLARVRALRGDETAAIREVPTASGVRTVQLAIVPSGIDGLTFVQLDDLTGVLRASARADDLAKASDALQTIATRMAHDVSGPLMALSGFAEMLVQPDSDLPPDQRTRLLERINVGTRALAAMTTSILREADNGGARPEDSSHQADDLFRLVRGVTDAQLAECGGTLLTRSSVDELPVAVGSVRQSLVNLVSNSIKYRHEHRRLIIEIDIDATDDGTRILVRDNGIGLSDDSGALFEPGTRGSDVGQTAGAGLGLSFARAAVERVAGSLQALPATSGASFQILLPSTIADTPLAASPKFDATVDEAVRHHLTAPQLERILDGSPVATFVIDVAVRQIVQVNQAATDLLGMAEADVLGRPGSDFVDQEAVAESLRRRVIDQPDRRNGLITDLRTARGTLPVLVWIALIENTALAVAQVVPATLRS